MVDDDLWTLIFTFLYFKCVRDKTYYFWINSRDLLTKPIILKSKIYENLGNMELDNLNRILEKKNAFKWSFGLFKGCVFFFFWCLCHEGTWAEAEVHWGQGSQPRRQSFNKQNGTSATVI